ncbi:hypothetical protein XENTR_v10022628 [Xenopus tropicalis]|nr:hypothetical protein XENTR_v10022628 [Xenopus tropicalis]
MQSGKYIPGLEKMRSKLTQGREDDEEEMRQMKEAVAKLKAQQQENMAALKNLHRELAELKGELGRAKEEFLYLP